MTGGRPPSLQSVDDLVWVFGYGSLIWRPDFPHEQRATARLDGHHRSLCVFSLVHRGTEGRPGLVFGLDRGGACAGVAYGVARARFNAVHDYLRRRELTTGVYRERWLRVQLTGGGPTQTGSAVTRRALCYVADRTHVQYAGGLSDAQRLQIIRSAHGLSGWNVDYVVNTMRGLERAGIRDPGLTRFASSLGVNWRHRRLSPDCMLESATRYRHGQRSVGIGPERAMLMRRRVRPYCGHYRKRLGL